MEANVVSIPALPTDRHWPVIYPPLTRTSDHPSGEMIIIVVEVYLCVESKNSDIL
jgi:hypothetical protein